MATVSSWFSHVQTRLSVYLLAVFFSTGPFLHAAGQSGDPAFSSASGDSAFASRSVALITRVAGAYAANIVVEKLSPISAGDVFELESVGDKLVIRGNDVNSVAVGLNHYLKYYCHTDVSWYAADSIDLPQHAPRVEGKIRLQARVKSRFFLNYCTFGYTMPWWTWKDWERLIDWMALNGVNMPLAITGEEAIWYRVWRKMGLSDEEIRSYFTGPAHLPWHRMSNLDHWQGPLPISYMEGQLALQKKIVQRERELDMTPVLPAFSGHVPELLKKKFPTAKISRLSSWGGFPDAYRSYFLDPLDSLFPIIQSEFLREQTREFGTDHIYGADPFNEVQPPSWDTAYLAHVANTVYTSLHSQDSSAVWLMMSWVFYFERDSWTNERIKAFLGAVPIHNMMLLDYYAENTEVWKMTESYFGRPFLWCYLGNFGGNSMLAGPLAETGRRIGHAFDSAGNNFQGIGSTLEGFDVNPLMYSYVFEKAWADTGTGAGMAATAPNLGDWIRDYADRRCGQVDSSCRLAWHFLLDSVYTQPARLGQATLTNARPSLSGSGNWTTDPHIDYSNAGLFRAWEILLHSPSPERPGRSYDVANIGRQVLGNYFLVVRDRFTTAYRQRDHVALERDGHELLGLLDDMDRLLATQTSFLLGKWLADARRMGHSPADKDYFERNARTILTTWGGKGQSLNDYANRGWAGLLHGYYRPRWALFIQQVLQDGITGRDFDEEKFNREVTALEWRWTQQHNLYPAKASGDAVLIGLELAEKYGPSITGSATTITNPSIRVNDQHVLNTFQLHKETYRGLDIFTLDGGMSAEFAVEKAVENLDFGLSHSWYVNAPGSGPNPVYATPEFLEKAVAQTVDTYNAILGTNTPFKTVILSTGMPPIPYISNTLRAPVLPLHFLASVNTVKEIQAVMDYSNGHGLPSYATLGYDLSVPPPVAWIKLLDLPAAYLQFLRQHQVQQVLIIGESIASSGETMAKQVLNAHQGRYEPGSIYILFPGNTPNDAATLGTRIVDLGTTNLTPQLSNIGDWESGVMQDQLTHATRTIKDHSAIAVWSLTSSDLVALYDVSTDLTLAFFKKNKIPVKGVAINPYLLAHPGYECWKGYIPFNYWQGNSARTTVARIMNVTKPAVLAAFPALSFDQLTFWLNSSRNFGGSAAAADLTAALTANGLTHFLQNDYTVDEVWNPIDGMTAPCEKIALELTTGRKVVAYKQWQQRMVPLTMEELAATLRNFPALILQRR